MNDLENFRYRARDGEVLLYDRVDPSFNVLDEDEELFYFAHTEYTPNFRVFDAGVEAAKKTALSERSLDNDCGDLGLVYVSCLPCFGFTDIIRPMGLSANDSIPRLVWGKYHEEGGRTVMPFSITGNHGLFDGIHIAMLLDAISSLAEDPAFLRSS